MNLDDRTILVSDVPLRADGQFVIYWMEHTRRLHSNFALDRAVQYAVALQKPLVVIEVLRIEPGRSTERTHQFVLEGMHANVKKARGTAATYVPCVERSVGEAETLFAQLAPRACVFVIDEFPMSGTTDSRPLAVRIESVDSCGVLPLRATERAAPSAYVFRRWAQRSLYDGWRVPARDPLAEPGLPSILPMIEGDRWNGPPPDLVEIDLLDRTVGAVECTGGADEGAAVLARFVGRVENYAADRNHPDKNGGSSLSPYLHHGHVAATEILDALLERQQWSEDRFGDPKGQREGWWGLDAGREAYLDQLIVWRELGFHFAHHVSEHATYDTLPPWALETLHRHSFDARPVLYSREELEGAATHDPVWNAAQRELLQTGRMHNYLRMLWGKKILEWSPTPRAAFDCATYLNDRWALDGCDPNSSSGVGWVFGRFDRPWGPRREIFGTIRYMSSASAKRKLRMTKYLQAYAEPMT